MDLDQISKQDLIRITQKLRKQVKQLETKNVQLQEIITSSPRYRGLKLLPYGIEGTTCLRGGGLFPVRGKSAKIEH